MGLQKYMVFGSPKTISEAYNMFACNGILFNHESPRRGETFVTRKITRATARIALGLQDKILFRKFRCQTRLGARQRLCAYDVDDIASRPA